MGRGLEESRISQHVIARVNHYHMQTISLQHRLEAGFFVFFPSEALLSWSPNFKALAKQRGVYQSSLNRDFLCRAPVRRESLFTLICKPKISGRGIPWWSSG